MPPKTGSEGAKKIVSKAEATSTEETGNKKRRTEDPDTVSQILAGVEDFSGMFCAEGDKENWVSKFWRRNASYYGGKTYEKFNIMRQDDIMCDVTLLAGSQKTPFRAHRMVLAATFEYFKVMFTSEMKESKEDEIHVNCVSPEDMTLLLDFAYKATTPITQENVHNITVLANHFGAEYLLDQCCFFIMGLKKEENSIKMVEFADRFKIDKLRINMFVDDLKGMDGLYAGLAKLPVDLVLEVIRHPATVICVKDPAQNEETLFQIVMARLSTENNSNDYILKLLESIHLPQASAEFLKTTEKQFQHIPGVKDLIKEAKKKIDPAERREWYLPRYKDKAHLEIAQQNKPIVVNGKQTKLYSPCVLIKGFPFFLYVFNDGKCVGIESPREIENLGLPYSLVVSCLSYIFSLKNEYFNGEVVKKSQKWEERFTDRHLELTCSCI